MIWLFRMIPLAAILGGLWLVWLIPAAAAAWIGWIGLSLAVIAAVAVAVMWFLAEAMSS